MRLIRQVISDLFKEIGSFLFYGFLTAMVLMAFIFMNGSLKHVLSQDTAIRQFTENNIHMVRFKSSPVNHSYQNQITASDTKNANELTAYYNNAFAKDGNAGTYISTYSRRGYAQVIILLGIYNELTPFQNAAAPVTFAVSADLKANKPETITFNDTQYPLYTVPENMYLYHPLYYIDTESGMLNNTLFVFSYDFKMIQELFPANEYPDLELQRLIERLILKNPQENDLLQLRKVSAKALGQYVSTEDTESFIEATTSSGIRTHQTYTLFYMAAALVLLGVMLWNIYHILKRKIPDYAAHHLFGAPDTFIFARMFLLAIAYHMIPLVGVFFIMYLNRLASFFNILLVAAATFIILFLVTGMAYTRFYVRFLHGLRGE